MFLSISSKLKKIDVLTGNETISGYKFFSAKYVTWCGVAFSGI